MAAAAAAAAAADEVDSEGEELDEDKAWVEMTDPSSNETYYFNSVTHETTWSRPLALGGKRQNLYAVDTCVVLLAAPVAVGTLCRGVLTPWR